MGISAAGMLSGLDVDGLVSSLMATEQQPLRNLQAKQSSYNSQLSAYGTLKSAVSTFQTAVKALSNDALQALKTSSSKTDIVGVSATKGGGATSGTYSIEVSQLAQSDKLVSSGVDTSSKFAAGGAMEITVGGKMVPVKLNEEATLAGVANAINKANAGVSATILNDGKQDRLVITGTKTGVTNTVSISASGSLSRFDTSGMDAAAPAGAGEGISPADTSAGMTRKQAAQNAEMIIDGIPVSKESNTVTDAIKGLTLNLAQTNVGSPVKVSLEKDSAAITKSVNAFIDAYNALASGVNKQVAYDANTKTAAVLNGDASARGILSGIRAELSKATAGEGGLRTLADIGIAFQRDGTLKLEKPAKLEEAVASNIEGLTSLFTSDSGVATRLNKVTEDMLGSKGVFKSRTDGLNASVDSIKKSQERVQLQLEQTEKRYRAQFTALDTMMTNMQNTNNYVTQQLAALSR